MRNLCPSKKNFIWIGLAVSLFLLYGPVFSQEESGGDSLAALLPEIDAWSLTEDPAVYYPETLFEYINGAAEIYLSYDFVS